MASSYIFSLIVGGVLVIISLRRISGRIEVLSRWSSFDAAPTARFISFNVIHAAQCVGAVGATILAALLLKLIHRVLNRYLQYRVLPCGLLLVLKFHFIFFQIGHFSI